ncbi:MAG: hypothetical protein KDD66_08005 [Bdellovibrionales bacterium]|nr:hypothetical protein [Bdellovibrionales bacterium]
MGSRKQFWLAVLISLILPAARCEADSYSEVEADIKDNAQSVIDSVLSNTAVGQQISAKHNSNGSLFNDPKYKRHPWIKGNSEWEKVWKEDDDEIIKKGFGEYRNECFDMQILGCCCYPTCDKCPWAYVGYWWPEVVVTVNNFCISALMGPVGSMVTDPNGMPVKTPSAYKKIGLDNGTYMDFYGGCFPDESTWRAALDTILGPKVAQKIVDGMPGAGVKGGKPKKLPAGLRKAPHRGNSAVTSVGSSSGLGIESTNLEAHLYRTWTDVEAYHDVFNPVQGWAECFTPKCTRPWLGTNIWPRMMTENADRKMTQRWRFPEMSKERVNDGSSCNKLYKKEWANVPETAVFKQSDVLGNLSKLKKNTCASYRASDEGAEILHWKNPIDQAVPGNKLGIKENSSTPLRRNCMQPEVGQVYPLVGEHQSDLESAGTISTALRSNEWASWCKWDDEVRTNVFNYEGALFSEMHPSTPGKNTKSTNVNRSSGYFWGPRSSTYVSWPTPPDKIQRIYPVKEKSDTCFTVDEADRRLRPELFPPGLYDGTDNGETRYVIWNYRTCCVCPGCDEDYELSCVPVTE